MCDSIHQPSVCRRPLNSYTIIRSHIPKKAVIISACQLSARSSNYISYNYLHSIEKRLNDSELMCIARRQDLSLLRKNSTASTIFSMS